MRDANLSAAQRATLRAIATDARTGRGTSVLVTGAAGTGARAAETIAAELRTTVYRVDLASIVSKFIGETEKSLDSVFRDAEQSGSVLLFDEADALFGKRTDVKDAHDRYANLETASLLGRIEAYPGVVVLATNLNANIDPAFKRRIRYFIDPPPQ
jgi:SpoVK/Ycf46/Vps4 family AAA+-type ATPase